MKRSSFLKALSAIPIFGFVNLSKEIEKPKTIKFSDIFIKRKHNQSLLRLRDSEHYDLLKGRILESGIPVYDRHPVYQSVYSIQLPYRKEYDRIEINHFFEQIFSECESRGKLFFNRSEGIMRFFHDKESGVIIPDIFSVNSWNTPGENESTYKL